VASFCEDVNEPPGSVAYFGRSLDWLSDCQLLRKGCTPCSSASTLHHDSGLPRDTALQQVHLTTLKLPFKELPHPEVVI